MNRQVRWIDTDQVQIEERVQISSKKEPIVRSMRAILRDRADVGRFQYVKERLTAHHALIAVAGA